MKPFTRALLASLFACTLLGSFSANTHAGFLETVLSRGIEKASQKSTEHHAQRTAAKTSSSTSEGFGACQQFFPGGVLPSLPSAAKNWQLRELCYDAFAVLHSGLARGPIYSVERLNRDQLSAAKGLERATTFFADARLPSAERAELSDYAGEGCDRGHLSPAADQPTAQAMAQSFSLANMICQAPENNRKAWASVEKATRRYVERASGDVYVFTGPAFLEQRARMKGRVQVPSHVFKLVYDSTTKRSWAHFLPNTNEARVGSPISYQELTSLIGFELLPGLTTQQ